MAYVRRGQVVTYGEHSRDSVRHCAECGVDGPHVYCGTQIQAGLADDVVEVATFTCCACDASAGVVGMARPELDGESHGWVIDRRAPSPAGSETVRPPAWAEAAQ